jgi:HEAT repeat protein
VRRPDKTRGARAWSRVLLLGCALAGGDVASSVGAPRAAALSFEGQGARLARELREGVPAERVAAAAELATLSAEQAAPLVALALDDPEIEVRERAARAAGALRITSARERTRAWLEDEEPALREIAVRAEGALGDASSVPLLARALGDPRFSVRAAAAEALGLLGLPACAQPLGTALEDSDATVRVVAASALGRIPGPEATRLLVARSLDPVLEVRVQVVQALSRRDGVEGDTDPRVGAVLVAALADDAEEVRLAATIGLGRARWAAAAPTLARMMESGASDPTGMSSGRAAEHSRLTRAALAALGRMDDGSARAAIVRALGRPGLRAAALDALREQLAMAPEASEDALRVALDAGAEERDAAVAALAALPALPGGEGLLRGLLEALVRREGSPELLLPALGACMTPGVSGTDEAVVALLAALEEPALSAAALDGLERAHGRGALDVRAVEPLLLLLGEGSSSDAEVGDARALDSELAARVARLLGRLRDPRAAPALARLASDAPGEPRRAALEALAELDTVGPSARADVTRLVIPALVSSEPRERVAGAVIARRHGDVATLVALLDALDAAAPLDRALALEAVVGLLRREDLAADSVSVARAQEVLISALRGHDPRLCSAASAALQRAPGVLGTRLDDALAPRSPGRGDPTALARLARAAGRQGATGPTAAEALLDAPVAALVEGVEDRAFPDAVVRAYALLTRARRGELDAAAAPTLCALARRREPGVRANAGLALAVMGLACEGVDPIAWIERGRNVATQRAGLAWALAWPREGTAPHDARRLARALERCLERAADSGLRDDCTAARRGAAREHRWVTGDVVDLSIVDAAGVPETSRLVSLRFPDGAILIVPTDGAGRVALRVDRAAGEIVVEDPFATVLER